MKSHAPQQRQHQTEASPNANLLTRHTDRHQALTESPQTSAEGLKPRPGVAVTNAFAHDFSRIPASSRAPLSIQAKLKVNTPGDIYEQEADRVAAHVMATPTQHAVSAAPSHIQRLAGRTSGPTDAAPPSVDQALATPGRPLEPTLRQDMEQRFGQNFSRVRLHSGTVAEQSAQDVNAKAYTVGHDIVFGAGLYAPGTHAGRRLLAHELAHVVQQSHAATVGPLPVSRPGDLAEREAEGAARAASSARPVSTLTPAGRGLHRAPGDDVKNVPARSGGLTSNERLMIKAVRAYFNLPEQPTKSKTTIVGILILENGEQIYLRSGEGGPGGGAERGGVPRGPGEAFTGGGPSQGNISTHVEGKAAAIMHQRNISQATLLIEEAPCKVCDNPHGTANITTALPPGAKLTIVDPGSTGHYWSSQRPGVGAAPPVPATPAKPSPAPTTTPTPVKPPLPKGSVFETKEPPLADPHGMPQLPKGSVFATDPALKSPAPAAHAPGPGHAPAPAKPGVKVGPTPGVHANAPRFSVRGIGRAVGGSMLLPLLGLLLGRFTNDAVQGLLDDDVKRLQPEIERRMKQEVENVLATGWWNFNPRPPYYLYITLDVYRVGFFEAELGGYDYGTPTVGIALITALPIRYTEGSELDFEREDVGMMTEHNYYTTRIPIEDLVSQ